MKLITAEETKGVGVQWSNLFSKAEPGNAMVRFILSVILFFVNLLKLYPMIGHGSGLDHVSR